MSVRERSRAASLGRDRNEKHACARASEQTFTNSENTRCGSSRNVQRDIVRVVRRNSARPGATRVTLRAIALVDSHSSCESMCRVACTNAERTRSSRRVTRALLRCARIGPAQPLSAGPCARASPDQRPARAARRRPALGEAGAGSAPRLPSRGEVQTVIPGQARSRCRRRSSGARRRPWCPDCPAGAPRR